MILLDNRYSFDKKGSGDRLGQEQWDWLDRVIQRSKARKDVKFIMIGAGVQMLPDRQAIESFKWINKQKLFAILKKHQVSNVVLISGDVHYSQLYKDSCPSLTG